MSRLKAILLLFILLVSPLAYPKNRGFAKPQEEKAIVYIYRTRNIFGSALEPSVFCDDNELARIGSGRYIKLALSPGMHRIHMTDKKYSYDVDMKAGEEYYFRLHLPFSAMRLDKGHGRLEVVDKRKGAKEIKNVKPVDKDKVKDAQKMVVVP